MMIQKRLIRRTWVRCPTCCEAMTRYGRRKNLPRHWTPAMLRIRGIQEDARTRGCQAGHVGPTYRVARVPKGPWTSRAKEDAWSTVEGRFQVSRTPGALPVADVKGQEPRTSGIT